MGKEHRERKGQERSSAQQQFAKILGAGETLIVNEWLLSAVLMVRRNLSSLLAPQLPLTQGVGQAAEVEPSQQLKSSHPPHVQTQKHPLGQWCLFRLSKAGLLTASLCGVRPQAQLTSLLSCVKKLLISWLSCHVPPLPNKAALLVRGSKVSQRRGSPGAPQHPLHTYSRAVGLRSSCSEGNREGNWSPSSSHCPARLCWPWASGGSVFHTSPSSRRAPEEQQCLKPHQTSCSSLGMSCCSPQKLKSSVCDFSHHFHGFKDEKAEPQLEMLPAPAKWRTMLPGSQDRGAATESLLWGHGGTQLCCSSLNNYLPCKDNKHSICKIPLAVDICRYNKPFAKDRQTHFLI